MFFNMIMGKLDLGTTQLMAFQVIQMRRVVIENLLEFGMRISPTKGMDELKMEPENRARCSSHSELSSWAWTVPVL